jgi:heterodisulfide reductase subunit C
MMNWGYSINNDNQIDFDRNSRVIYDFICQQEPSFKRCISCGSCTATCSAGNFTSLSLRKLNLLISRGETKNIAKEIAQCMLCGKCILVCPRGINTRNVIMNMQKALNYKQETIARS